MIVQVTGFARAGKGEVTNAYKDIYNFYEYSYAAKVKELASVLNVNVNGSVVPYWDGRDDTKRFPCIEIGAKLRKVLGKDIWVKQLWENTENILTDAAGKGVVISDTRYGNEVQKGLEISVTLGVPHLLIWVENPFAVPLGEELEETLPLKDYASAIIHNDYNFYEKKSGQITLKDVYNQVVDIHSSFTNKG